MKKGIALSILSSVLFSILYYYSTILYPLAGVEIFAWRVLLALPVLALLISRGRGWGEVATVARRLRGDWKLGFLLVISAALIGVQLWLFVWAPLHQKGLDVSLGYFVLPLLMVLVGRGFYRERISAIQWAAVAIAAIGVTHEFYRVNAFSWATALVVFGYPPYFMLRRKLCIGSLTTLWFDMLLLAPIAVFVLQTQDAGVIEQFFNYPRLLGLIPLLGLISSVALVGYIAASRLLPLGLFGLLGYVEPVLLFGVAWLLLNESMEPAAWFTYVPIWIAIVLLVAQGLSFWMKEQRSRA